ncbi:MAG: hypothetical protein LLF99_07280 [Desulfobacteraceae bacterium]|nr:hypothetical protein [Desulfobacteraceae bacterium]
MTQYIRSLTIVAAALLLAFILSVPGAWASARNTFGGDMGSFRNEDIRHLGGTAVPGQTKVLDGINSVGSDKAGNTLSPIGTGDMGLAPYREYHLGGTAVPGQTKVLDGINSVGSDKAGNVAMNPHRREHFPD